MHEASKLSHCSCPIEIVDIIYTVEPQYLGPEGVQYTEKFSILKVLLNDTLVKVLQVQLVHA